MVQHASGISCRVWDGLSRELTDERSIRESFADEAALIEQAKTDKQALTLLYRQHYAAISGYLQRRVGRTNDAEDLTSEVFLEMVRRLPRYQCRGAPFRAWLYRIATTRVNRWARRSRRSAARELADLAAKPDLARETADIVRTALLSLPLRHQTVLSLYYLEELSVADLAAILGCAEGTVKSRLSRARDLLKTILIRSKVLS